MKLPVVWAIDFRELEMHLAGIAHTLTELAAGQVRQERAMSKISDAIKSMQGTVEASKAETDVVLQFLKDHAADLNEAVTQGDLDAIAAVNAELQRETAALDGAVHPPAPPAPTG